MNKKIVTTSLSVLASIGVVVTTVSAVKATPLAIQRMNEDRKAFEDAGNDYTRKDAVLSCWKCYIPSMIFGVSTVVCIFGANAMSQQQQASLASAYALLSRSYEQYKDKVKELAGEDIHKEVMSSIAVEHCEDVRIVAPTLLKTCEMDLDNDDDPENLCTFYDPFSDRYFETTALRVLQAEYHLNRNFVLGGAVTVNDFYQFLGLDVVENGDIFGWTMDDGLMWIDFDHTSVTIEDDAPVDAEVYVVDMAYLPSPIDF